MFHVPEGGQRPKRWVPSAGNLQMANNCCINNDWNTNKKNDVAMDW